ncbi:MAG: hypothetical protein MNPFHGCM_01794 [Gemmatimonadaceae bacterium]|nr:hypothetical protein [Gemmatimonadaceae bacterium]
MRTGKRMLGRHGRQRDLAVALALAATVVTLLVQARTRREERISVEAAMAMGSRYADSLSGPVARESVTAIRTADAIAALYLERVRLGLGSPFRVVDQSQRDPLLPADARARVGHALLASIAAGKVYEIEPAVLDLVASMPVANERTGGTHFALIDSVIRAGTDPRVGELTIRLAYRLAFAAGNVSRRAPEVAIQVAAQRRDRVLAIHDARALLREALASGTDPLVLLPAWRSERRLGVERPVLLQLTDREEAAAVAALPMVAARIEEIARTAADAPLTSNFADVMPVTDGLARRMAGLAELRASPPQAPVAVTVTGYGSMLEASSRHHSQRELLRRFVSKSVNEEALAAEYALLVARTGAPTAELAMTVLTAGVALRPYAQERAWLPGESGPAVAELQSRYGLASVEFDENVPARWRAYYRRALDDALTDMRRVFPLFDVTGLKVRFGESPLRDRALAMHDPVSRTVYFPTASGAGVMAHEFAHDLDWQAARRRYGVTVGYRTDRAMRLTSDWLAGAVRRMASAPRSQEDTVSRGGTPERPTEIFARNVDWFVSAALARDARMNGYLSAAQDPVLTGYAAATTPEVARDAGEATLRALDGISPPNPKLRAWFDEQFGGGRRMTVHESVRRVLEAQLNASELRRPDMMSFAGIEASAHLLRAEPATSSAWACVLDGLFGRDDDRDALRAVTQYAAESRARGVVQRWAGIGGRLGLRAPWRMRALEGAPWSPETRAQLTREIRDAIMWHALRDPGTGQFPTAGLATGRARCKR